MIMGIRFKKYAMGPWTFMVTPCKNISKSGMRANTKKTNMIYEACIIEAEWVAGVDRRKWRLYIGVIKRAGSVGFI